MHDSEPRLKRRSLIVATSSVVTVGLAGCLGGDDDTDGTEGDDSDTDAESDRESSIEGDIDSVEYEGETLVAFLEQEHDVDRLDVLSEDGSRVDTANIGTETRIELFDIISEPEIFSLDNPENTGVPLTILAVDNEDEEVGEAEIEYAPEVELEDLDIDFREGDIQLTVTNTGEGPIKLSTDVGFTETVEITPEVDYATDDAGEPLVDTTISYPHFELTDESLTEEEGTMVEGSETEQITRESEPIIGSVIVSPDSRTRAADHSELEYVFVTEPIEDEEVPVDRTEITVGFEAELNAEPSQQEEIYEAEITFSNIIGHRDEGQERTGGYTHNIDLDAGDAEIVSFEDD